MLQKYSMQAHKIGTPPLRIPVPVTISIKEIGLGDVIMRATSAMGFKPCEACQKRAAILNQKIVFGRSGQK